MSVLVTGGTGFVGAYVVAKFAEEGFDVCAYDNKPRKLDSMEKWRGRVRVVRGDVTDLQKLVQTIEQYHVGGIVHTAAMPNEEFLKTNPVKAFEVNVGGTLNALEAARLKKLGRVVYASTGALFGRRRNLNPIKEGDPVSPSNFYSTTKRMSELLMEAYNRVYGLDTVTVRLSHVYGPGLLEQDERTTYVAAYLWKAMRGEAVEESSGGDFPANLTYVKDAANGICLAYATQKLKHRLFHISSGQNYRVSEVAAIISRIVPKATIRIGPGMGGGASLLTTSVRGPLAIGRAERELGYRVEYTLEDGLRDFAAWAERRANAKRAEASGNR